MNSWPLLGLMPGTEKLRSDCLGDHGCRGHEAGGGDGKNARDPLPFFSPGLSVPPARANRYTGFKTVVGSSRQDFGPACAGIGVDSDR